jgi:pyruvate/2-oxoglutarate dehydrogenase complex dihydrolipoamide acyltransferase (E2) component
MATQLLAPSMGEGVEELTVTNWLKKEGETVKELEVIVELETDKVTTEIPSPAAGTLLKILVQKNETAKVGSTLAWIGQPGEILEADAPGKTPPATAAKIIIPTEAPRSVPVNSPYAGRVSPLVKKIVTENQIDLNLVQGTGQDGRITKEDVLNYLENRKGLPPSAILQTSEKAALPDTSPTVKPATLAGELIPHSSLRKQIAERMVNSQHTSPHVLTVMEADLSKVLVHRAANKDAFAAQGVNLTLTAYFCSAIVSALKVSPEVNSSWTDEGILRYRAINLGVATSLGEDGLIVPVIKDADLLSLQGLAQKINDLSARARAKKLLPEEVKGGTFTLTNHGTGSSLFASPIIFQPQAAILGTGMMQKRPVVVTDASGNDAIAIRPMIYLSLVFDHRILDGAGSDRFLKKIKEVLENWN